MDDIDNIYLETTKIKKGHKRIMANTKKIKVRSSVEVAKDNYKKAKQVHKDDIKGLRRNIRSHRLMIRQARNTYKIVKLQEK